jgi:hypothetical protein
MRRHRRLVLMERFIPFLAAFVGLVALAGAIVVQSSADARSRAVLDEIASVRGELETLRQKQAAVAAPAGPSDADIAAANGTVEALLALQDRMNTLEAEWANRPEPAATATAPGSADGSAPFAGEIDPSWPTEDCIPLGTRFMASVGDEMKICQSPVVIKVSAITGDSVLTENAGVVNETASAIITGSNCRLQVFTADAEGFAEMRVSCN